MGAVAVRNRPRVASDDLRWHVVAFVGAAVLRFAAPGKHDAIHLHTATVDVPDAAQ